MSDITMSHGNHGPISFWVWCKEVHFLLEQIKDDGVFNDERAEQLKTLLSHFVSGGWLQYYSQQYPRMVQQGKADTTLWHGFEGLVEKSREYYQHVGSHWQRLIDQPFPVVVEASYPCPQLYIDEYIPTYNSAKPIDIRDPRKIRPITQAVGAKHVQKLFLPDELTPQQREDFMQILHERELDVKALEIGVLSELEQGYASCEMRYGRFSSRDVLEMIDRGEMVPIFC